MVRTANAVLLNLSMRQGSIVRKQDILREFINSGYGPKKAEKWFKDLYDFEIVTEAGKDDVGSNLYRLNLWQEARGIE